MKFWVLALVLVLQGCSGIRPEEYRGTTPPLDLRRFFSGELRAYGMLQDRSGLMTRRFTVTMTGTWQGDSGTLNEHFVFDDGEQQDRIWHLQATGEGRYRGTAADVIGTAEGSVNGAVLQWNYQLEVPWRGSKLAVTLDDWLYLIDEQHLLNKTELTKFGFKVGELTLVIEKLQPGA